MSYWCDRPILIASTAHYSKFVEECKDIHDQIGATSITNPAPHVGIESCKMKPTIHNDIIDADYSKICCVLENFIENYFGL